MTHPTPAAPADPVLLALLAGWLAAEALASLLIAAAALVLTLAGWRPSSAPPCPPPPITTPPPAPASLPPWSGCGWWNCGPWPVLLACLSWGDRAAVLICSKPWPLPPARIPSGIPAGLDRIRSGCLLAAVAQWIRPC